MNRKKLSPSLNSFFFVFLLTGSIAHSETLIYSFSSAASVESSTAVVNTALGILQPPFQVDGWDNGGGVRQTGFSVGDGHNGVFDTTTYLRFDDGTYSGDQVIHVNTDTYADLQFTRFSLATGWTLRPSGSRPLVIRSLATVLVDGSIDCNGGSGAVSGIKTSSPSGGIARCGGSNGGSGASTVISAGSGAYPATQAALSGQGATGIAGGGGGGGGGMANTAPAASAGMGTQPGAAGAQGNNDDFSIAGGGSGGGGGAVYDDPTHIPRQSSGAGGGAGGGIVQIYAAGDVTIHGSVLANGGNGGTGVGTQSGGAGGGGGGGSILVFSGGNFASSGSLLADKGLGGIAAGGGTGGSGGDGGTGRTWVTDSAGMPQETGPFDPVTLLPSYGSIDSQPGTYDTVSTLIDFNVTRAAISAALIDADTSGASTVELALATGDAPFAATAASWQPVSQLAQLSGHRYARFRVRINHVGTTPLPVVRSVSVRYTAIAQQEFNFASCQSVAGGRGGNNLAMAFWFFLTLLMPLALALQLRRAPKSSPADS